MNRWVVFRAIFVKALVEMKRYLFNTISGLVTMYIVFILLFFGAKSIGGSAFQAGDTLEGIIVGYMLWVFAIVAYSDLAWSIAAEAEIGTLEQLYLSPAGFTWVNLSFMAARFIVNVVWVGTILLVMMLTSGYWLHIDLLSIVPLIIVTVAACYGFGLAMGGLALVFKRIQNSFQILQFVFVGFLAVPLHHYVWIKYLPLSMGNSLLREVMVHGTRIWQLPAADLTVAGVVGIGYFLLGFLAFQWCVNIARDRGLMGHY